MNKIKMSTVVITLLAMVVSLIGCGTNKQLKEIDIHDISKIKVIYEDEEGVSQKLTSEFGEDTEEAEEFRLFIKETVLPHIVNGKESSGKNNEDEMKVLWHIQVYVGDETYQMNGFADYPDYWSDLISYMGIE